MPAPLANVCGQHVVCGEIMRSGGSSHDGDTELDLGCVGLRHSGDAGTSGYGVWGAMRVVSKDDSSITYI